VQIGVGQTFAASDFAPALLRFFEAKTLRRFDIFPIGKILAQTGAPDFFRVGAKLGNRCRTGVSLIPAREYKHLSNRIETKKIGANRRKNPIKPSISSELWLEPVY
jgi:hypothetical protein